ncbi:hypothetical protein NYE67_20710 [Solibacillus sp. FSL W8-0474]|uniref:hypothetical protein n=1 Tax=Solibacillus sp. FSL W8-0474 TaxID=2975336 RepID=UPI0030F6C79C
MNEKIMVNPKIAELIKKEWGYLPDHILVNEHLPHENNAYVIDVKAIEKLCGRGKHDN